MLARQLLTAPSEGGTHHDQRRRLLLGQRPGRRRHPRRTVDPAGAGQDREDGLRCGWSIRCRRSSTRSSRPRAPRSRSSMFDSPTDGKNAVVTKSVDFGTFGIAAAILGGAAGEPVVVVGALSNKGMGVISKAGSDMKSIKDLKGHKVGIWPGSTQEVFIFERLKMEGMTVKDITPVRVPFGEMPAMLAARRPRRLCRRRAGPGAVDHLRCRPARRVSLRHRHGRPEHDLRHPRGDGRQEPGPREGDAEDAAPGGRIHVGQHAGGGRRHGAEARRQPCRGRAGARRQERRVCLEARRQGAWARPRPMPSTCST